MNIFMYIVAFNSIKNLWVKVDSEMHDNRISSKQAFLQTSLGYLINSTSPLTVHCIVIAAVRICE